MVDLRQLEETQRTADGVPAELVSRPQIGLRAVMEEGVECIGVRLLKGRPGLRMRGFLDGWIP